MISRVAAACLLCATGVHAQRAADALVAARPAMMQVNAPPIAANAQTFARVPTAMLVAGGLTGAAAAYALGTRLGHGCDGGECWGYVYAAALEPLFLPLGVHLANRARGSLGITFLQSFIGALGGGLVAIALTSTAGDDAWPLAVGAIVTAQTAMAVAGEREMERRRLHANSR